MPKKRKLGRGEWVELIKKWAKKNPNGTISRQTIIKRAAMNNIATEPDGEHGWAQFSSAIQFLNVHGRLKYLDRGVYRVR